VVKNVQAAGDYITGLNMPIRASKAYPKCVRFYDSLQSYCLHCLKGRKRGGGRLRRALKMGFFQVIMCI
jgi:hypothetical protein